jgi:hypothetical protein
VSAQFVPNAIHQRLPQIGLERALVTRLESLDPPKRLQQGLLDKILCVGGVTRPPRQPTARPASEGRDVAREQRLKSCAVARANTLEELERRVGSAWQTGWRLSREQAPIIHGSVPGF